MAVLVALAAQASDASAQTAEDRAAIAQQLFNQGRGLMEQYQYDRACQKFEESERLDPGGGTLLNLALCNELRGKTATAWSLYHESVRASRLDGRTDRREFAEEHLAALEPRLSRLRIRVPSMSRLPGLAVRRDGVLLGEGAWDEALALDPGNHTVEARLAGHVTFKARVNIKSTADLQVIEIPALAPLRQDRTVGRTQRWIGYAIGTLGVAALGFGTYFGVRAINRDHAAKELCPDPNHCDIRGYVMSERAADDGRKATYFFVSGGVLVAGSVAIVLTAPSPKRASNAAMISFAGTF